MKLISQTSKYISFSAALCMILAMIEYAIPKPIPFMRLGLANLPILLAVYRLEKKDYSILVILKILSQALISGTFLSYIFLFSCCGTIASATVMFVLNKIIPKKIISCVGISLSGALANNLIQLILARFILFGESTRYIAPILLITGFITGLFLGLFAEKFKNESEWFKKTGEGNV